MTPTHLYNFLKRQAARGIVLDPFVRKPDDRAGIYMIYCHANHKCYIGSATVITDRWWFHRRDLKSGKHGSPPLMEAWRMYGGEKFEFLVIEFLPPAATQEELVASENLWLMGIATISPRLVFNTEIPAKIGRGKGWTYKHTEAAKEKIRQSKLGKPGHIPSAETRALMSSASKGRKHTEASKMKNVYGSATRMTDETVIEMRRLYAEGWTQTALGIKYGMKQGCIYGIVRRRSWKHLP